MELTRPFSKLNKNDAHLAGGKGASLGEMTQAGIPVPPGFVVLSESFEQFLRETDLVQEIDTVLHSVKHNEIHTVEAASEKIRELILNAEMPTDIATDISKQFKELNTKYVAVRSSATAEDGMDHAWAGQLESYLNTQEDDVLTKVKLCWSSLFTPRAIFYRFEKGLHSTKISVAVVVQKMVESEVSGIAFSVHPVTEDYNQLIIEAGFGLGEAIVSGSVTPDSYVVEKEPRNILDINVSTQDRALYRSEKASIEHGNNEWKTIPEPKASSQVLTEKQILELSEIILKIENHYGFPCDIEWAFEAGKFYIVQSRPITTLAKKGLNKSGTSVNKEKDTVGIDAKDYYLNFKAKGPGLYFAELGTTAYDPNGVINIVKEGLVYSFYTKKAEKENAEFAKKKEFFDVVSSAKQEIEELHKKYQNFDLPSGILNTTQFDEIHTDLLKGCYLYRYVNNSYLDTFMTTGTKDQVSKIGEYKNEMQKCLFDLLFSDQCVYKKVLRNISTNAKIPYDDIEQYYHTELIALVTKNEKLGSDVITSRKQSSAITKDDNEKLEFMSSEKADALFDVLYGQNDAQNVLKGMTGHTTGKVVRGKVKIIHTDYKNPEKVKKEMAEMEEGQVLVSQITAPELMPAIKKAVAIVTDIGGMLSHAAIISRELNIPCVIGTKNASEVLKDGDLVEVDSEKGIVKIISVEIFLKPDNYIRMFAGKSFPYLFSNVFLGYYNTLDVVSVQGDGSWISFFPKSHVEKTNKEGAELYTSKEVYKKYKDGFDNYIDTSRKYFESAIKKDVTSTEDVKQFFKHVSNLFVYYSKTEFFYTDGVDQSKMIITVKEFDELKLGGRAYLNSLFFEANGYIKSFVRKIAKQTNADEMDLLNYNTDELVGLIESGKKLSHDEVEARHTFFESKDLILFGADAKPLIDEFFSNYLQISDVIKGTIANKGMVRGKARVLVPDAKDFDKIAHAVKEMKEGEILVAETTSPDIIAACKKAAAIITNQGGQLSHAAIVARELGIPCIIGTDKDVILNIKTGDELEVDANKGIIKILK